jgi:hypothetical protein
MKLKCLFIIGLSAYFNGVYAQSIVRGKVIDFETKQPIPYMFIYRVTNYGLNTYSDSLGNFSLQVNNKAPNDTIALSSVGYVKSRFVLDMTKNNVLEVKPDIKMLNEVVVSYKKGSKVYFIGAAKKIFSFGGGNLCNTTGTGYIFLNEMKIPTEYSTVTISKIALFIDSRGDAPVRLRIFSKNNKTAKPLNNLLNESVLLQPYKRGWNTFDLTKSITIKENDWFLGIEILPNTSKNQRQCIGYSKSNNNSFFTMEAASDSWAGMNFNGKNELMIRAGVQFD